MSGIGAPEIILILLVLVLLFGARKLPDLARGTGRALRIFKSETKGLVNDDDEDKDDDDRERERVRRYEQQPSGQITPQATDPSAPVTPLNQSESLPPTHTEK